METYHVEISGTSTTVYAVEAGSPQEAVQKAATEGRVVSANIVDPHCTSVYRWVPAGNDCRGEARGRVRDLKAVSPGTALHQAVEELETHVPRHDYVASYSGMCCAAMVVRDGFGDACGLPAGHGVHQVAKLRAVA